VHHDDLLPQEVSDLLLDLNTGRRISFRIANTMFFHIQLQQQIRVLYQGRMKKYNNTQYPSNTTSHTMDIVSRRRTFSFFFYEKFYSVCI
jgi:hypothetical protein